MPASAVDPLRVLMVAWDFPPAVAGGMAAHVDGLAHAMASAGHEVAVFTRSHPGIDNDQITSGLRILRAEVEMPWIDEDNTVARTASANHQLTALASALGEWRPDVVHCHDWTAGWASEVLARWFGVPLVTTFHGTERSRHGGHLPPGVSSDIHAIEWWLAFRSQRLITSTRLLEREIVSGFEFDPDLIERIPNGIDPLWWRSGESVGHSDDAPFILTWGRVQYEKGFQVLARAISTLRPRLPGIECMIAGRGSYLPELQSQIDLEGVSDVITLPGFLPDQQLRETIHRATCVVIPSLYEPFGVVALEALASGAALVVAETGGLAELVGGTGAALMFEPGNAAELADRIEQVISNPELAQTMRQRAAELLDATYSWAAIADRTTGVYRQLTGR